jgi:hypothetical protein
MTAEFFDANWRRRYTRESSKKAECAWKRSVSLRIRLNEQPGFMCSSLRSGGQRVTSVCHAITP